MGQDELNFLGIIEFSSCNMVLTNCLSCFFRSVKSQIIQLWSRGDKSCKCEKICIWKSAQNNSTNKCLYKRNERKSLLSFCPTLELFYIYCFRKGPYLLNYI